MDFIGRLLDVQTTHISKTNRERQWCELPHLELGIILVVSPSHCILTSDQPVPAQTAATYNIYQRRIGKDNGTSCHTWWSCEIYWHRTDQSQHRSHNTDVWQCSHFSLTDMRAVMWTTIPCTRSGNLDHSTIATVDVQKGVPRWARAYPHSWGFMVFSWYVGTLGFSSVYRLDGLVVKASESRAEDPVFESAGSFPGRIISVTSKLALQWLPCQAPGIIGSVMGLVGQVSV